ncbi:MAG: hypothetical protein Aurels2KO_56830 [Aureliella sp.]
MGMRRELTTEQWTHVRTIVKPQVEVKLRQLKISCQSASDIVQSALGAFIADDISSVYEKHLGSANANELDSVAEVVLEIAWEKCKQEANRKRRKVDGAQTNSLDSFETQAEAASDLVNRMLHLVDQLESWEARIGMRCRVLGFSQREIAEIMGCSESKVSRTIQASISALSKEHADFLNESEDGHQI